MSASDSEDDPDFVPGPEAESDASDGEPALKRARTSSPKPTEEDEAAKKQARQQLWASFQASVDATETKPEPEEPKRMVKIQKKFLYAGETTVEIVEVPEDSADAKKWPLWQPPSEEPTASSSSLAEPPAASMSAPPPVPAPAKKPGPRKPRTSLAAIPTQKARKLSTLDKSAMDWKAHVDSEPSDMKDELDANRRGGGYLEKVEFLGRVDSRREEALEASKSTKRRR